MAGARHMRQAGFTLLELMLAMTLTVMLLGMLSAGVYTAVNNWENDTSVLEESLDKSLIILQVERALLGAFPHTYVDEEELSRFVYFEGLEDELRWVSTVSPSRRSGLTAWRLEARSSGGGMAMSLTPAFSDNPNARFEEVDPTTVLADYRVEFRYLMQRNPEEKEWVDEWPGDEMQSLPRAVHMVLTPTEDARGDEVLEILAPIKNWRHKDIQPDIPPV